MQSNKIKKTPRPADIPVIILCGGRGSRLQEETQIIPKPLVRIGEKPILWHIMQIYSAAGFNRFILPVGYKGEKIKEYFYHYAPLNSDFTVQLGAPQTKRLVVFNQPVQEKWKITAIDTGLAAMTGARIKKIEKYVKSKIFMVTYGDGLANINIKNLLTFHLRHGKIGTVTGVPPLSRFGELDIKNNQVIRFGEKPPVSNTYINGGFFVFNSSFFKYLKTNDECILEREPLEKLAAHGELMAYKHNDFWHCMDTIRDLEYLKEQWECEHPA